MAKQPRRLASAPAAPPPVENVAAAIEIAGLCAIGAMVGGVSIPPECLQLAANPGDPTDGIVEVRIRVLVGFKKPEVS